MDKIKIVVKKFCFQYQYYDYLIFYQNVVEKKVCNELEGCLKLNDLEFIQKVIDNFDQFDLDDKGKREKVERKKNFFVFQKGE